MIAKTKKIVSAIVVGCLMAACSISSVNIELEKAQKAEKNADFKMAAQHYLRAIKREPTKETAIFSAKKLANIALMHLKDFNKARYAYNFLIQNSLKQEDRLAAQENLALLYFEKLSKYPEAILELSKFIEESNDEKKIWNAKLMIARSYFYQSKFYQAKIEVDEILDKHKEGNLNFRAGLLKASILHSQKEIEAAIDIYKELLSKHPQLSLSEKVPISMSVCYEDLKQFERAKEVLAQYRDELEDVNYVDFKIRRIQETMDLQPGAKGLKK